MRSSLQSVPSASRHSVICLSTVYLGNDSRPSARARCRRVVITFCSAESALAPFLNWGAHFPRLSSPAL
eukprot:scaffold74385_cov63-Phaeocystis_antarctica.AAC.1